MVEMIKLEDAVSYVKVGNFERNGQEYDVKFVHGLYAFAACAAERSQALQALLIKEKKKLKDLESVKLEEKLDDNDLKVPPEANAAVEAQKAKIQAVDTAYRYTSRASRHYKHYRMYENALALFALDKNAAQLEAELEKYYNEFKDAKFNFYLRRVSDLPEGTDLQGKTFGLAKETKDLFVLFNPMTQAVMDPLKQEEHKLQDFIAPGVKLFTGHKSLEKYIEHFYAVNHNAILPAEVRVNLLHLNEHQAKQAIHAPKDPKDPAKQWDHRDYQKTKRRYPRGTESPECQYEDTQSLAPEAREQKVEVTLPISRTQSVVRATGKILNFGFTLLGMVGVFAGLSILFPIWPAAIATGVLFFVDWERNKGDFHNQLLQWARAWEISYPHKNGINYKGLLEKPARRLWWAIALHGLVGLEFAAVAVPGGIGLVEAGKSIGAQLLGLWGTNKFQFALNLVNPFAYVAYAVAIGAVAISFFGPATGWTNSFGGLHTNEVKPEHWYNHERVLAQMQNTQGLHQMSIMDDSIDSTQETGAAITTGFTRIMDRAKTASKVVNLLQVNEFQDESLDDKSTRDMLLRM